MLKEKLNYNAQEKSFYPSLEELREKLSTHYAKEEIFKYFKESGKPLEMLFIWPEHKGGALSDIGIMRHMIAGNIEIYPFFANQLGPNSYDIVLGPHFWRPRERNGKNIAGFVVPQLSASVGNRSERNLLPRAPFQEKIPVYNPLDLENLQATWEKDIARPARELMSKYDMTLVGIKPTDLVFMIEGHEMVLGHSDEVIGGKNVVYPTISGTSTSGRNRTEMCSDANMGNIGFVNRYTLEILNKSEIYAIPLVVGEPYASFTFHEVTEPPLKSYTGRYSVDKPVTTIRQEWQPEMMLAQMKRKGRQI